MMPPFRKDMFLFLVGIQGHQQSKSCNPITEIEVIQTLSISEFALFFWYNWFSVSELKVYVVYQGLSFLAGLIFHLSPQTRKDIESAMQLLIFLHSSSRIGRYPWDKWQAQLYLGFLLLLDHMSQFFTMLLVLSCLQKLPYIFFSSFHGLFLMEELSSPFSLEIKSFITSLFFFFFQSGQKQSHQVCTRIGEEMLEVSGTKRRCERGGYHSERVNGLQSHSMIAGYYSEHTWGL